MSKNLTEIAPSRPSSPAEFREIAQEHPEKLERLAKLAATCCQVPIAQLSVIDAEYQYFLTGAGTPPQKLYVEHPLCQAILKKPGKVLTVSDLQKNKTLKETAPIKSSQNIRSWMSFPLYTPGGEVFGALCVMDFKPRRFQKHQKEALEELAAEAMSYLKRQHQQAAAKIQNDQLKNIATSARAGTWDWDVASGRVAINDVYAKMLGRSRSALEPFYYQGWQKLANPEDLQKAEAKIQKCFDNDADHFEAEVRLLHKNNSWIWTLTRGKVLERDEKGKPLRIFGTHVDISDLKIQQDFIKQAEAVARLGAWEYYPHEKKLVQSKLSKELHEIDPERNLEIDEAINFYPPGQNRDRIREAVTECIYKGNPFDLELEFITAGGKKRWVRSLGRPELVDGKCVRIFGTIQDITELQEEKLKQQRLVQRFQSLVENSSDAFLVLNETGLPTYASPSIRSMLGYEPDELLGESLHKIIHPDHRHKAKKQLQECLENPGKPTGLYKIRVQHKEGPWRWIEGSLTNLLNDPSVNGIVDNFRDVSHQVALSQEREKAIWALGERVKEQQCLYALSQLNEQELSLSKLLESAAFLLPEGMQFSKKAQCSVSYGKMVFKNHPGGKPSARESMEVSQMINARLLKIRLSYPPTPPAQESYSFIREEKNMLQVALQNLALKIRQQQSAAKLQRRKEQLRRAHKIARLGFWGLESPGGALQWSRELEAIFPHWQPPPRSTRDLQNGLHPDDRRPFEEALEKAWQDHQPRDMELRVLLPKGHRWMRLQFEIHLAEKSNSPVITGVLQDIHASKELENELRDTLNELSERHREHVEVLERIGDGFFAVDSQWRVQYWNRSTEGLLGMAREKILGKNLWDFFPEALETNFYREYKRALQEQISVSFEEYFEPLDKWFEVNAHPSKDGLSIYFRDVTTLKRSRQMIEAANERFRLAAMATRDAIWDIDLEQNKRLWSDGFKKLFGQDPGSEEPSLENWKKRIHPNDHDEIAASFERALDKPEQRFWQTQYRYFNSLSGQFAQVNDSCYILRNEAGKATRVVGALRDETRQREMQRLLEHASELARVGSWEWDPQKEELFWSAMVHRIHELSLEEKPSLEKAISYIKNPADRKELKALLERALKHGDPFEKECQIITAKNRKRWIRINGEAESLNSKVLRLYGSIQDIDERKKTELQLRKLNEDLERHSEELATSNRELEQFAYVASHDLQEPLRMVSSFLTQLERKYSESLDEKARRYIHFATDGAYRMRQIILDLLEYSQVGKTEEKLQNVDLHLMIEDFKILFQRALEESNASLTTDPLPVIYSFKAPLRQMLQNLLDNALKYRDPQKPPEIHISCKKQKGKLILGVHDNGLGIAPEYHDKVFGVFQRLHTQNEYGGTGMGLSLAKKIANSLGGDIWIQSREGKGSSFYFSVPINAKPRK